MIDRYKYNQTGIADKIAIFYKYLEDYQNKVKGIDSLIKEIESSSSWIDISVKTAFIDKCNTYITKYNQSINIMHSYLKHLSNKADDGIAIENKGARMMLNE